MEDERWMTRALQLAALGQGSVEPNPMVGCVVVRSGQVLAEGWHQKFGGPHAERVALANATDPEALRDSTWYVTLEPCCHTGKTPPCTDALLSIKPQRVVIAMQDPFPKVSGGGIELLQRAGIEVTVGVLQHEAERLNAPYLMRLKRERPWVIGKWAMTLDGKIATRTGHSQWISGEASRRRVHELRGRVDAIVVGIGTATADDPLLTARPAGPRVATRVVFDRTARLPIESQLVATAREFPLLIVCDPRADNARCEALRKRGVEVLPIAAQSSIEQIRRLLSIFAERSMTNLLVEGGAGLLASFFEADALDEVMAFVAPKIIGGEDAASPIAGFGLATIDNSPDFEALSCELLERDVLLTTRRATLSE